jgi:hypothetical protein
MSALEKTLRQIDEQRQNAPKTQAVPSMMALPSEPLLTHTLLRWLLGVGLFALLTAAAAGTGYGLYRLNQWLSTREPSPPPTAAQLLPAPTSSGPMAGATHATAAEIMPLAPSSEVTSIPPDTLWLERPAGFDQAVAAWTSGRHAAAAQLWLDALRRQPPSTMALLLTEQQQPEQVNATVLAQAAALPWLVIPGAGTSRWTVLVLTPAADLDRTHAWLARAGGPALQWGTVAHWVARSEAAVNRPQPAAPPVLSAPAAPVSADKVAQPPAPSAVPVAPVPRPVSPAASKTTATPAANGAFNTATAMPSPPPVAETPQLSRSPASDAADTPHSGTPSAARAIESEFSAAEQDLAAGRYDAALRRVRQLETNIGANWRTHYLTGVALSGLQRWSEAVNMLTQARQGNTAHARVALYLSVAQQELDQHEAAIQTLNQALGSHAAMPELWLNKAHSLQVLERGDEATFHYRRFLELSANREDLSPQRAWVQKRLDTKASAW